MIGLPAADTRHEKFHWRPAGSIFQSQIPRAYPLWRPKTVAAAHTWSKFGVFRPGGVLLEDQKATRRSCDDEWRRVRRTAHMFNCPLSLEKADRLVELLALTDHARVVD